MADRGEVRLREGRINELIALYKRSYIAVVAEIEGATDAGKIQRVRVMKRINAELEDLGVEVDKWIKAEIPQYYLDGANVAVTDLRRLGVDVKKGVGLAAINREAIRVLTDEVSLAFAQGITGISRNSRRILDEALKQQINLQIAEGKLRGETLKAVSARVREVLRTEGLSVLEDRAGKKWSFDAYSNMLVRTKAVEARNLGLANRMLQNGYDLVQVTNHNSSHPACAKFEGKILTLTGQVPVGTVLPGGYKVFATYDQAKSEGLFHPNCQHAINVINPELAAKTKAYSGE